MSTSIKDKIYLDMAFWYYRLGYYELSIECCNLAIEYNKELDIIFQIMVPALKQLASKKQNLFINSIEHTVIEHTRRATCIAPNSASNHYQLAIAYHNMKNKIEKDNEVDLTKEMKEKQIGYYQNLIVYHLRRTKSLDSTYIKRRGVSQMYGD